MCMKFSVMGCLVIVLLNFRNGFSAVGGIFIIIFNVNEDIYLFLVLKVI